LLQHQIHKHFTDFSCSNINPLTLHKLHCSKINS